MHPNSANHPANFRHLIHVLKLLQKLLRYIKNGVYRICINFQRERIAIKKQCSLLLRFTSHFPNEQVS